MYMNIKYRKTYGPELLFELYLKIHQNTQSTDIKCLKFHNKMGLKTSISLVFISVQKDIIVCTNIDTSIFF